MITAPWSIVDLKPKAWCVFHYKEPNSNIMVPPSSQVGFLARDVRLCWMRIELVLCTKPYEWNLHGGEERSHHVHLLILKPCPYRAWATLVRSKELLGCKVCAHTSKESLSSCCLGKLTYFWYWFSSYHTAAIAFQSGCGSAISALLVDCQCREVQMKSLRNHSNHF